MIIKLPGIVNFFKSIFSSKMLSVSIFRSKDRQIVDCLEGKWKYTLTYTLPRGIKIGVKGFFELGNNKKVFINGTRHKFFLISSLNSPMREIESNGNWHSDWIQYCHDGKIRFVYSLIIPNLDGGNFSEVNEIKVFVESTNFSKGDTKIRAKQFPFSTDGTRLLLGNSNLDTPVKIPYSDLEISYLDFFRHAFIEAEKI